jgi:hypothetical protein
VIVKEITPVIFFSMSPSGQAGSSYLAGGQLKVPIPRSSCRPGV